MNRRKFFAAAAGGLATTVVPASAEPAAETVMNLQEARRLAPREHFDRHLKPREIKWFSLRAAS